MKKANKKPKITTLNIIIIINIIIITRIRIKRERDVGKV